MDDVVREKLLLDEGRIEDLCRTLVECVHEWQDRHLEPDGGKLTTAQTPAGMVRCTGRLTCACGTQLRAGDIEIETDGDDVLTGLRAVCSGCHQDLFEVGPC